MRSAGFALTIIVTLGLTAAAQDGRVLPPVTMRANTQVVSAQPGTEPVVKKGTYEPPFCPPKTCLYYAGDYNSANLNADDLFNWDYNDGQLEGQVWVGVKPNRDAIVTGATFVEFQFGALPIVNPTPFAVQVGIKPGQAGKTVCNTSGTATATGYQEFFGTDPDFAITIKNLSQPCKLKKGRVYYVNLLPTSNNGYGYVVNVEDAKPKNHHGWKNHLNDCYFNAAVFGLNYVTCNSQGSFSEFSIALTGKE